MKRKLLIFVLISLLAGLVVFINHDPTHEETSLLPTYYLEHFKEDTFSDNAVAAIYLNYRVFDSIFETLILLVSVMAVIHFSWRHPHD